jgi:DNA-binding transcriptional MerR regulator
MDMDKNVDAFRTIAEVGEYLDLPQHVLRFWETRFIQIKPMKRGGGRRYYRPSDVELLKGIRHLLYDEGYTIKGVQRLLKDNGAHYVIALSKGDQKAADESAQAYKNTPKEPELTAPTIEDTISTAHQNMVIGAPKLPTAHRFFGFKTKAEEKQQGVDDANSISSDNHALLQEVLFDLLECKRLLDQTRV